MKLILVRHPQPLVAAGVCYGRTDLDVDGQQMEQIHHQLAATLPHQLALYSSPLRRCAALASALAPQLLCAAPRFDPRLAEIDFGTWEMQPWDQIPRAEIDAWSNDLLDYHPGGGESLRQMAARVAAFLAELQRQRDDAIVICHAGTMRLLSACHAGLAPPEAALQAAKTPHKIAYGTILVLQS